MSREIRFRAWTLERNRFLTPAELSDCSISSTGDVYRPDSTPPFNKYNDEPIFMQYTGQRDITGKEIYEDDIVRYDLLPEERDFFEMASQAIGYVRWDDYTASWVVAENEVETVPKTFFQSMQRNYEVIGNRYETPELLTNEV